MVRRYLYLARVKVPTHKIQSRIERLDTGLRMHVIPIPANVANKFVDTNRVILKIGSTEYRRAIQGIKSGEPYIAIGQAILKELKLRLGTEVTATLSADPQPDTSHCEPELIEVLNQDKAAKKRWDTFTPGKQRSLNHHVSTAKRSNTRIRRALELAAKIRTYTLYGDHPPGS